MSNNGIDRSSDAYIWIQGNIRGVGCFIFGATSRIKGILRNNFRIEDSTNGDHIAAAPTIVINFLVTCGYRIKETTTIDHFNLLWTLQPQNFN
ncbi:hypothetical protein KQX54_010145 [Cotesia glomerata]|uniref:Uncharacterized protein n=1 Tax=Cotesia glomerata TaxID=32391 RepID=A0AAV7J2S4_COTGL|nr:hypothetical protein KQX54_010145 [Cotesia glomerata]